MVNTTLVCTQKNLCFYEFENFSFSGSTIIERTTTTGKTNRAKHVLAAFSLRAIGAAIKPSWVVGAMAGGVEEKKEPSIYISYYSKKKNQAASVSLRNITTGEIKTISTKLTQAQ